MSEIEGLELADLGAEALVPPRRLGELAKYGMRADASALRRHPDGRRLATLLATVRHLEGKSVDDALELLDLLMATELVNKAQNASNKEKVRKHPKLAKSAARLAVAVEALFASDGWGGPEEEPRVAEVWEAIEAVMSRAALTRTSTSPGPGSGRRACTTSSTSGPPKTRWLTARIHSGIDDVPLAEPTFLDDDPGRGQYHLGRRHLPEI
ncbi:hypothetical protein [Nonomuraea aurantiaca]|uniref:hypothetical protein n=1 Tax=Nonomuraea aurantiaca TaxID=2878562 RepID=UPI0027E1A759|nr:hypothetical protein [Nonomuraea aurantiaca]